MATLMVRDESVAGEILDAFPLRFPTPTITVRQLIRERVYQEVRAQESAGEPGRRQLLVRPEAVERQLNGQGASSASRAIDWRKQVAVAYDAFQRNGFFILLDEHQAVDLDERLTIRHDSVVSFIKLTPLVGG